MKQEFRLQTRNSPTVLTFRKAGDMMVPSAFCAPIVEIACGKETV